MSVNFNQVYDQSMPGAQITIIFHHAMINIIEEAAKHQAKEYKERFQTRSMIEMLKFHSWCRDIINNNKIGLSNMEEPGVAFVNHTIEQHFSDLMSKVLAIEQSFTSGCMLAQFYLLLTHAEEGVQPHPRSKQTALIISLLNEVLLPMGAIHAARQLSKLPSEEAELLLQGKKIDDLFDMDNNIKRYLTEFIENEMIEDLHLDSDAGSIRRKSKTTDGGYCSSSQSLIQRFMSNYYLHEKRKTWSMELLLYFFAVGYSYTCAVLSISNEPPE